MENQDRKIAMPQIAKPKYNLEEIRKGSMGGVSLSSASV